MPPSTENNSIPFDIDEDDEKLVNIALSADEWHFLISCLGNIYLGHGPEDRRKYAYDLQRTIVHGLADKD